MQNKFLNIWVSSSTETMRKPSKTAVHLWEFLLDLLLDEKSGHVICWINREAGEFKLKNQEEVARRWGNLKHRPGMNYDKLSRALRYYYQKGIIKKVCIVQRFFGNSGYCYSALGTTKCTKYRVNKRTPTILPTHPAFIHFIPRSEYLSAQFEKRNRSQKTKWKHQTK